MTAELHGNRFVGSASRPHWNCGTYRFEVEEGNRWCKRIKSAPQGALDHDLATLDTSDLSASRARYSHAARQLMDRLDTVGNEFLELAAANVVKSAHMVRGNS